MGFKSPERSVEPNRMVAKGYRKRPAELSLFAALATAPCCADTVLLTPVKDNTIFEDNINFSGGISSFVFSGPIASGSPRRTLLQFDLSTIPSGAQIDSVSLRFVVNRAATGSSPEDLARLHRLTASWGEGLSDGGTGGAGTQATPEDATWAYRFFGNPAAGIARVPWSQLGGDFSPIASAQLNVGGAGAYTASGAGLLADVAAWVSQPTTNHGWILLGPEGPDLSQKAKRIISRESPSLSERPQLTIDFTPPAEPAEPDASVPMLPAAFFWGLVALLIGHRLHRSGSV